MAKVYSADLGSLVLKMWILGIFYCSPERVDEEEGGSQQRGHLKGTLEAPGQGAHLQNYHCSWGERQEGSEWGGASMPTTLSCRSHSALPEDGHISVREWPAGGTSPRMPAGSQVWAGRGF